MLTTDRQEETRFLREQVSQARAERDSAYIALAEIESLVTCTEVASPLSQIATILRRFRLDLILTRQRQFDRLVTDARQARRKNGGSNAII